MIKYSFILLRKLFYFKFNVNLIVNKKVGIEPETLCILKYRMFIRFSFISLQPLFDFKFPLHRIVGIFNVKKQTKHVLKNWYCWISLIYGHYFDFKFHVNRTVTKKVNVFCQEESLKLCTNYQLYNSSLPMSFRKGKS